MIKQYQLYFVFLLIIVLTAITSCDYQPTGGKYTDIDSNFILPELYLIQPSNIDTIFVMIDSEIIIPYEIAGDLSKFNKVNIYLNSRLIRTSEKVKDSLKLNFKDSLKQIYNFSIQIVNHSGTGSIADKLNMEGSIFERDWIIKLFDPNELQPNPIKWENIDGSLKLSWDTCTFNEFYCYELTKSVNGAGSSPPEVIKFGKIYDRSINYFLDSTYTGEKATYNFKFYYKNNKDKNYHPISYPDLIKEKELPKVSFNYKGLDKFELNWSKSSYYNNIKGYFFKSQHGNQDIEIRDNETLTYGLNKLMIGMLDTMKFLLIPKYSNISKNAYYQTDRYDSVIVVYGENSFDFTEISEGPDNHLFFTQSKINSIKFKFCKYSKNNQKIIQENEFEDLSYSNKKFRVSPSGKNIVIKNGKNLSYSLGGNLSNYKDLTDVELTSKNSTLGFEAISISDNGIIAVMINKTIYVYDLINNKLNAILSQNIINIEISKNGDFIALQLSVNDTRIYKIINGRFEIIGNALNTNLFSFDNLKNEIIFYYDNDKKFLFSLDLNSEVSTMIGEYNRLPVQITPKLNQIIIKYGQYDYFIRNLRTYELINNYSSAFRSGYLSENIIYFPTGAKCRF